MKKVRRFLVRLLEDTEDDLSIEQIPPIPIPLDGIHAGASLDSIQNNHLYHLTVGHNQHTHAINALLTRVGRIEAKVGLIIGGISILVSAAIAPFAADIIHELAKGIF